MIILKLLIIQLISKSMFWFLFFSKHFLIDFILQRPYQYKNKGKFLHLGGVEHAFLHGFATFLICYYLDDLKVGFYAGLFDMVCHYIIDYAKVNIDKKFKWSELKANSRVIYSNNHYISIGFDQYLHCLTYLIIFYFL